MRWSKPFGSTESDTASCWFRRDVEMKSREEASVFNRNSPEREQAILPNAQRQRGNTISKQSTNIIKQKNYRGFNQIQKAQARESERKNKTKTWAPARGYWTRDRWQAASWMRVKESQSCRRKPKQNSLRTVRIAVYNFPHSSITSKYSRQEYNSTQGRNQNQHRNKCCCAGRERETKVTGDKWKLTTTSWEKTKDSQPRPNETVVSKDRPRDEEGARTETKARDGEKTQAEPTTGDWFVISPPINSYSHPLCLV